MKLRRKLLIASLALFLLPLFLASSVMFYLSRDSIKTFALERQRADLQFRAHQFSTTIENWKHIVDALAETPSIMTAFKIPTIPGPNARLAADDLEQTMRLYPIVRIARILNHNGSEVVRINRNGAELQRVPEPELQNKMSHQYFQNAIRKSPGEIDLSKISLNRENGKIEKPAWPTLRISTTLADSNGKTAGLVILNFDATALLDSLGSVTQGFGVVVDQNGAYLVHPQNQKVFNPSQSLAKDSPGLWQAMKLLYKQRYDAEAKTHLTWQKINTLMDSPTGALYSISIISDESLFHSINQLGKTFGIVILTVLILISILCFLAAEFLTSPIQELTRGARVIGSGNLSHRIEVKGSEEIQTLSSSLNEMAMNLESMLTHRNNLSDEIEKRKSVQDDLEHSRYALLNILEDLKDQKNALIQSEQRFHIALNATPIAIMMVNSSGELTFINSECCRLFDYEESELVGRPVELLIPDRYQDNHPYLRNKFFSNPARRAMGEGRDLFAVKKGGVEFPVEIGLNPVMINREPFVLSSVIDLTERAQNEADLRFYNDEMEQLLYSVSHDLKSPMVTILGFSDLIQESLAENDINEASSAAARVVRAGKTMERTIRDLLRLNRMSREEISPANFKVHDLLDEIQSAVAGELSAKALKIFRVVSVDEIVSDRRRIEQALLNLVTNAIKYGCNATSDTIWIGVEEDARNYLFFVRDSGPGIAVKDQSRIFQQFKRLQIDEHGTGLGLAIVSKCARLLGGKAWVDSKLGEGATFWFSVLKSMKASGGLHRSTDFEMRN